MAITEPDSDLRQRRSRRTFVFSACGAVMLAVSPQVWAVEESQGSTVVVELPDAAEFTGLVVEFMKRFPDYQDGGLITQTPVEKLLLAMRQRGWVVEDPDAILSKVLPDNDFLVQQLRSPKGRLFWEKIRELPEGIDRLDHLARMPQGKANVNQLIQKLPDGHTVIVAMTTTERGRRLGERLSKAPRGKGFNDPTGRIYTAEQLGVELYPLIKPASLPAD